MLACDTFIMFTKALFTKIVFVDYFADGFLPLKHAESVSFPFVHAQCHLVSWLTLLALIFFLFMFLADLFFVNTVAVRLSHA